MEYTEYIEIDFLLLNRSVMLKPLPVARLSKCAPNRFQGGNAVRIIFFLFVGISAWREINDSYGLCLPYDRKDDSIISYPQSVKTSEIPGQRFYIGMLHRVVVTTKLLEFFLGAFPNGQRQFDVIFFCR